LLPWSRCPEAAGGMRSLPFHAVPVHVLTVVSACSASHAMCKLSPCIAAPPGLVHSSPCHQPSCAGSCAAVSPLHCRCRCRMWIGTRSPVGHQPAWPGSG
jgi:hypothetical protein